MTRDVEKTELAARTVQSLADARHIQRRDIDDREAFGRVRSLAASLETLQKIAQHAIPLLPVGA
ncbi:hypothetical protein, partial [Candidatus Binatus sp.]|uniref:hypothetical protein n=1 Tax=Candidatus Binatus sp. TaxID=2811406 RepID=UPI003BB21437